MVKKVIIPTMLCLMLTACGIKGNLELPDEEGVYIPPHDNQEAMQK